MPLTVVDDLEGDSMHRGPQHGLASDPELRAIEQPASEGLPAHAIAKAFQLAFFIRPDRPTALETTVHALACLDDQLAEQEKRKYFHPQGSRTKASRNRAQLLQHLILVLACSVPLATRLANLSPTAQREELVIRFLAQLVRLASRRNSFYVNLAISRILHDYSTSETIAIHDLVTQDPERARGDAYFRYDKGLLFKEIRRSFGTLVETTRQQRGELRLLAHEQPTQRQIDLIRQGLRLFTPWQTQCPLADGFDPLRHEILRLRFTGSNANEEHPVELRRMHVLLHPTCYAKITDALGLEAPYRHLRVPRFTLPTARGSQVATPARQQSDADLQQRQPSPLISEERHWIDEQLRSMAQRRRRWSQRLLGN